MDIYHIGNSADAMRRVVGMSSIYMYMYHIYTYTDNIMMYELRNALTFSLIHTHTHTCIICIYDIYVIYYIGNSADAMRRVVGMSSICMYMYCIYTYIDNIMMYELCNALTFSLIHIHTHLHYIYI